MEIKKGSTMYHKIIDNAIKLGSEYDFHQHETSMGEIRMVAHYNGKLYWYREDY
jgi:hypothetical protein